MLISAAIRSRTSAVGVGFLLNSISSVVSWSWVARCLFWFFCCCVRVLFRGGLLAAFWPRGDLTSGSDLIGVAPEAGDSEVGEAADGETEAGAMAVGSMFEAMAADIVCGNVDFRSTISVGVFQVLKGQADPGLVATSLTRRPVRFWGGGYPGEVGVGYAEQIPYPRPWQGTRKECRPKPLGEEELCPAEWRWRRFVKVISNQEGKSVSVVEAENNERNWKPGRSGREFRMRASGC